MAGNGNSNGNGNGNGGRESHGGAGAPLGGTPRDSGTHTERERHCNCPPWHHCGYCPPHWDPWCGGYPHHGRHRHHHRRHYRHWPMPGGEFFGAMMDFAGSAAGSRGRWWRQMAEAAREASRDFDCDPCYDPCAWPQSYCDPCEPQWSWRYACPPHCDPCEPQWPWRNACPPHYEPCDPCDDPCHVNLKEVADWLKKAKDEKLKDLPEPEKEREGARLDCWIDSIIHSIKANRAAEAMRRKKWSRTSDGCW
jgi:hypothetical protein